MNAHPDNYSEIHVRTRWYNSKKKMNYLVVSLNDIISGLL